MEQILLHQKFPIFKLDVEKTETDFKSAQELTDYFKGLIDDHDFARFIAEFDHYSHTKGMADGQLADELVDARNIIFCFGTNLAEAEILSLRPRSIGIAETSDRFVLTFMQAPMELANKTMKFWVKSIVNYRLTA